MRENAAMKARRYLGEGRVVLRELDEMAGVVQGDVRGNGSVYAAGRDERGWFCNCPARGQCAHIIAIKSVTAVEPRA